MELERAAGSRTNLYFALAMSYFRDALLWKITKNEPIFMAWHVPKFPKMNSKTYRKSWTCLVSSWIILFTSLRVAEIDDLTLFKSSDIFSFYVRSSIVVSASKQQPKARDFWSLISF